MPNIVPFALCLQSYEAIEFTSGNAAYNHFELFSTLLFALDFVRTRASV